jgi:endonuclease/exonuclease/phosphatase family metal-dependent hydrolase
VRFDQARTLCTSLDALPMPYLVVGDFNDEPGSRTLGLFAERTRAASKSADTRFTYPADVPTKEIDFVQAGPPARWRVGSVQVVDERIASDHRPLLAVLTLQPVR